MDPESFPEKYYRVLMYEDTEESDDWDDVQSDVENDVESGEEWV